MPKLAKMMKLLLTILLAALLAACPALGVKTVGSALSGEEIKALVDGNTLQGPAGTELYDWYYQGDGAVTGVIGASNDDSGTWLIKNSKVYCHTWDQYFDGVQHCYEFYKTEGSGRYVMINVDADRGENIEIWAVRKGNPFNM
jgi:hypothetical protein